MPKYINVDKLRFPNVAVYDMMLDGEAVPVVRLDELRKLPSEDVAPVKRGRWIEQPPDFDLCGVAYYQCSECGKEQQTPSNYCQFCGANNGG